MNQPANIAEIQMLKDELFEINKICKTMEHINRKVSSEHVNLLYFIKNAMSHDKSKDLRSVYSENQKEFRKFCNQFGQFWFAESVNFACYDVTGNVLREFCFNLNYVRLCEFIPSKNLEEIMKFGQKEVKYRTFSFEVNFSNNIDYITFLHSLRKMDHGLNAWRVDSKEIRGRMEDIRSQMGALRLSENFELLKVSLRKVLVKRFKLSRRCKYLAVRKSSTEIRETSNACSVCMDEFGVGKVKTTLSCGHAFCRGCLNFWFDERVSCPLCGYMSDFMLC